MLDKPIQYLKGIGPKRAQLFQKLGIRTIGDLLYYFPRRYEDWFQQKLLKELRHGVKEAVCGNIIDCCESYSARGILITKVKITDGSCEATAIWFNQPYLKHVFQKGLMLRLYGKVERRYNEVQILSPQYEIVSSQADIYGKIIPVYSTTEGLDQKIIRKVIGELLFGVFDNIVDPLPSEIIKKVKLIDKKEALRQIHFPSSHEQLKEAQRRLAFDELFLVQLVLALSKKEYQYGQSGIRHVGGDEIIEQFLQELPFTLSKAQLRVWDEIKKDMESPYPMNRLIQGDVGSGKTVVALMALVKAWVSGFQGVLMVPTEVLAEQHYYTCEQLLTPLGIKVALLKGSLKRKEKETIVQKIAEGTIDIVIGTHALLQEEVEFLRLGLVITDEQHRFGVRQRAMLQQKGKNPDVLVMTATPIPRTLALTIFGDLDISIIDELPPGRKDIKTFLVPSCERYNVYAFLLRQIQQGFQAYIVCPLIDESEKITAISGIKLYNNLIKKLPNVRTALLHGQMLAEEKEEIIHAFRTGEIQVLVSTTIIEVGVNVPNASVIIIENAERFGLAQLHQLRGRVGRGTTQSYCFLISDVQTREGRERLEIMTKTNDGFLLAEKDLELRGPGEFWGFRQHGHSSFKFISALGDSQLLKLARDEAFCLVFQNRNLDKEYPLLWRELNENMFYKLNYMKIS